MNDLSPEIEDEESKAGSPWEESKTIFKLNINLDGLGLEQGDPLHSDYTDEIACAHCDSADALAAAS